MRIPLPGRSRPGTAAPGPEPRRARRRALPLAAAAVALALTAAACGGDDEDTPTTAAPGAPASSGEYTMTKLADLPDSPTLDKIADRGKIIIGTKVDQPLFGLQNPTNGEYEGFDTEIARLLAIRIFGDESKIEFVESISKNREPYIQQGRVDAVVATYTINDTRKELVSFAGPYYIAGQDIMVKADNTSITSVDDLNGKNVCSVQGSTSEKNLAAKAPQAKPLLLDNYSACAEALGDGRVDAVTTDDIILLGLIDASDGDYKLVGKTFTTEPYGIGLPRDDTAFREFVNDTLEEAYTNGDWAKAFEKTVGVVEENTPTPPTVDRYALS
ncbi:glutamate ABC transporter substrate-binding protein [Frankia sp. CNm7]|uniref:Glutamate ABC transporter substrate-binding protein n=1 Tax=Frankia nepalensis TaxID=1836974 RepID=A0A937RJ04_9ACTN|nr:glutamate ABC transporter substrate-binding protein [Frankia nepalensis]MBL7497310.1 glutamate ABC transporter substrate-binding protein [Frankia nepalensis]MBL7511147.1 glutamate ABC transporter substrate-binding protein [Frankia nepalensis]MBL7519708.1 glutamate ABC transporter substrate-binding protein [Frankia nepalensis]MBL7631220.1 glutamate ABC transporter substrate-binding protein [Frankia nepalensis]